MRLSLRGDSMVERLALRLGLVPTPAAEAWGGMALSGVLVAATRLGLIERLSVGARTAEELCTELRLDPTGTRLLLECLRSAGHLSCRAGRYRLAPRSRRWLSPDSPLSVARFVAGTGDYWTWWQRLPDVVRDGVPVGHHDAPPEDPYWRRYITGQFELARLSAGEVAKRLRLRPTARTLLDVGGGHGWYSVELCRRHPQLSATVLDLPGSARIGHDLVSAAGMGDRVTFREGDALVAELGQGYDAVLCFNLIHHLDPEQIVNLLTRIHAALAPGGSLAVLDAFSTPDRRLQPAAATLGMFMFLSSGAQAYTESQLYTWLRRAGFGPPRRVPARRIPGLALYRAGKA